MRSLHINQQHQTSNQSSELNAHWQRQTVNEFSVNDFDCLDKLAPTLATLSQQGRWIVLVGAPKAKIKQLLSQYGIASNKVLLVHPKDQIDALWAMEQALMSGTSSAVLGWPGHIEQRDIKRLKIAAKYSSALAFVFPETTDTKEIHLHQKMHLTH